MSRPENILTAGWMADDTVSKLSKMYYSSKEWLSLMSVVKAKEPRKQICPYVYLIYCSHV